MRIVGVGQMYNFQTGAMEDQIQILSPNGVQFSVPTTNEGAATLVKIAMQGQAPLVEQQEDVQRAFAPQQDGDIQSQIKEKYADAPDDAYPEGAEVFGGPPPQSDEWDQEDEPRKPRASKQLSAAEATKARLGLGRNAPDRSGVPSATISNVDDKGNPKLPPPPEDGMDDEEDPGEVDSI